jgi:hypothetical protein
MSATEEVYDAAVAAAEATGAVQFEGGAGRVGEVESRFGFVQ